MSLLRMTPGAWLTDSRVEVRHFMVHVVELCADRAAM